MMRHFTGRKQLSLFQLRTYKKTIEHLRKENPHIFNDSKVLMRVDFNVPTKNKDGKTITDDSRVREAIPTINYLINAGAKLILVAHSRRPKGKVNEKMRMWPAAKRLSELINKPVATTTDCIGPEVDAAVGKLKSGEILLLENTRFHPEEEENDPEFAQKLAQHADIFVNDSFGTAHRGHASTEGVCKYVQHKVAGFLMDKELNFLKDLVDTPVRPFAAIVGGAKVSTKISVIRSLINKCDKVFIGGGMVFTFYKAMGLRIGNSIVEDEFLTEAREVMELAKAKGVKLILPVDAVVAEEFKANSKIAIVPFNTIPEGWMGLDIGPQTVKLFNSELKDCRTVLWNGPMGVFEFEAFSKGTFDLAHTIADLTKQGVITIIGGGDSVAAVRQARLSEQMTHISTGGGAALEMLKGKVLPGVAALDPPPHNH